MHDSHFRNHAASATSLKRFPFAPPADPVAEPARGLPGFVKQYVTNPRPAARGHGRAVPSGVSVTGPKSPEGVSGQPAASKGL
ncbi:MAG: hypothetical protein RJB55_461 [Verrucomicrobiota bacterium]